MDYPLILPVDPELLMDPSNNPHPLVVVGQLRLAAWKLSSTDNLQQEFWGKLPNSWLQDGAMVQTERIRVLGRNGIAGVQNSKLIPFYALYIPS